jgi:hypothetical protein
MGRRISRLATLLVLWAAGSTAAADGGERRDPALSVVGRDVCITAQALRPRIARWLRGRIWQPEVEVSVAASAKPVSFQLRRGAQSVARREFDVLPSGCNDRLNALALAIAIALEQDQRSGGEASVPVAPPGAAADAVNNKVTTPVAPGEAPPAQTPGEAPGTQAPAEALPSAPRQDAPQHAQSGPAVSAVPPTAAERAERTALGVRAKLGGALLQRALPKLAFAFVVGAELASGPLSLDLAGLITTAADSPLSGGRTRSQLSAARVLACAEALPVGLAVQGCAGAIGGLLWAQGKSGYDKNRNTTLAWVAALARASMRYPSVGVVSVRLAADLFADLVQPELRAVRGNTKETVLLGPLGAALSIEIVGALP